METKIKQHECLIGMLELIEYANKRLSMVIEHRDKYYGFFPRLIKQANHEIEILNMAIGRIKNRYELKLKQLC